MPLPLPLLPSPSATPSWTYLVDPSEVREDVVGDGGLEERRQKGLAGGGRIVVVRGVEEATAMFVIVCVCDCVCLCVCLLVSQLVSKFAWWC